MLQFLEPPSRSCRTSRACKAPLPALPPQVHPNFPLRYQPGGDSPVDKVKTIAVSHFVSVLTASPEMDGLFRSLLTVEVDGERKPLLLVGNAHGRIEDGHIIAILNPDQELLDQIVPGCAYNGFILKEILAGRCDLALDLWVDAYKVNGVAECIRYVARQVRPAAFKVT